MQAAQIDIQKNLCNGCGICVRVCPARAFAIVADKAELNGNCSFACDHCAAACPKEAISVTFKEPREPFRCKNFVTQHATEQAPVEMPELFSLMRARRSCRVYQERSLERELLENLVKIGLTAPSGTNSQKWTFTIIETRAKVLSFGETIAAYYQKLNRLSESAWLRQGLKFCGRPELDIYYREYYESIKEGMRSWYEKKEDRLFHGAPAAILVGARPGASCPHEDALLATQNILLGAQALGLGSCLIGFAVEALRRDRKIKANIKIPADEKIYAVIALGYPAIIFSRPAGRRKATIRWSI